MVPERRSRPRQCAAGALCGRYGTAGADGTTGAGGVGATADSRLAIILLFFQNPSGRLGQVPSDSHSRFLVPFARTNRSYKRLTCRSGCCLRRMTTMLAACTNAHVDKGWSAAMLARRRHLHHWRAQRAPGRHSWLDARHWGTCQSIQSRDTSSRSVRFPRPVMF